MVSKKIVVGYALSTLFLLMGVVGVFLLPFTAPISGSLFGIGVIGLIAMWYIS